MNQQQQTHRKGILLNKIAYKFSLINYFSKKEDKELCNIRVGGGIQAYSWRFCGENSNGKR